MTRRHDAARKDRRKRHVATAEEALYSVEAILRAAAESQAHEERQDQRANGAEAGTPNPDADDEDANQGQQAGNGEEEEGQQAGNGEEEEGQQAGNGEEEEGQQAGNGEEEEGEQAGNGEEEEEHQPTGARKKVVRRQQTAKKPRKQPNPRKRKGGDIDEEAAKAKKEKKAKENNKIHKTDEPLIPKTSMFRLIREIAQKYKHDVRFRTGALVALHYAAEGHLVGYFTDLQLAAYHANRITVMVKDSRFLMSIKQANFFHANPAENRAFAQSNTDASVAEKANIDRRNAAEAERRYKANAARREAEAARREAEAVNPTREGLNSTRGGHVRREAAAVNPTRGGLNSTRGGHVRRGASANRRGRGLTYVPLNQGNQHSSDDNADGR